MNSVQINGAGVVVVIMLCYLLWLNIVAYFIVVLNLSSRLGVAKTSSAVLRCHCVRFSVVITLFLDQFVSVSPRFVGPYNGGGGFHVL